MRAFLVIALTACVGSKSVSCPDGIHTCPEGTVCATVSSKNYCVYADQLGCTDGACSTQHVADGACHEGVCLPIACGNALLDPGEVCDDGNTLAQDGCSSSCASTEICGNATIDTTLGEECDDGVAGKSYDGCSSTCRLEVLSWREVTANTIPPRSQTAMVFDTARKRIVLFGGAGGADLLGDTWEWDGNRWILRTPASAPKARAGHMLAYDPVRQRVVLFGGFDNTTAFLDDTWEWDGLTWMQIQPPTSPQRR